MGILNPILGYLAGALSILSPCVLPLVPIVLSAAGARHPLAPAALAGGVAASFTLMGVLVAMLGFVVGVDNEFVRREGGAGLSLVSAVLLSPSLQASLAHASGPLGAWANERMDRLQHSGLAGQAGLGVLLGAVWTPCVGPTLGAASSLGAQGRDLGQVALVMFAFGVGAASVLVMLGYLSAGLVRRVRGRMRETGLVGRKVLGAVLLALGLMIVTGFDRSLEAFLVSVSPDWLTSLTTRY